MNKATIGFTNPREQGDEMADIKRLFTPEFRNRLDATVSFKALDEEIILRVVDKFLLQLESQLAEKKVEVTFTDALRKHLAKKGFDPLMGARPMQRLIQDTIRRALADELLFGRLVDGGRLTVDIDDKGEVLLDIQPPRKSDKPKAEPATGLTLEPESDKRAASRPVFVSTAAARPGPAGSTRRTARTARGCSSRMSFGATKNASAAPRRTRPMLGRRHTDRARCPRRASIRAAEALVLGARARAASAGAARRSGSGGTPSASPSRMSITCANSWITTL